MSDQETLRERLLAIPYQRNVPPGADSWGKMLTEQEVDAILPIVQAELAALRGDLELWKFRAEQAIDELAAQMISKLRSRFTDLADDFEKHGNAKLRHIDPAERLGGAVECVCAYRIRALLAERGKS